MAVAPVEVIATDPAAHPKLNALFAGPVGIRLDSLLASLKLPPQFANGGNGGEFVLAVSGVIIVLVAGSIWRRCSLHQPAQEAP